MTEEERVEATARAAYERYGDAVGWRVVGGGTMPRWEEQRPRLQSAWREAARGALGLPPGCEPGAHGP